MSVWLCNYCKMSELLSVIDSACQLLLCTSSVLSKYFKILLTHTLVCVNTLNPPHHDLPAVLPAHQSTPSQF